VEINEYTRIFSPIFGVISGILLLIATTNYMIGVQKAKRDPKKEGQLPRPLSWLGWTLMMGISLVSQVIDQGFHWNQISMAFSTLSCLVITLLASKNKSTKPMDYACWILGMICVAIYLATKNALLTTSIAIMADLIVGIPTLHNAWVKPSSERSIAWTWGIAAWTFGVASCIGFDLLLFLFPVYLFFFNLTMVILTNRRK
jgi:hypothetical protein